VKYLTERQRLSEHTPLSSGRFLGNTPVDAARSTKSATVCQFFATRRQPVSQIGWKYQRSMMDRHIKGG